MDKLIPRKRGEVPINPSSQPTQVEPVKNSKNEVIRHTSQLKYKKGEHKKFTDLIVMLLSSNVMPYYAEFNTFVNFYESSNIPTCGVNITNEGMNFYWNKKFVDGLNSKEALFLLLHEDFHLLFDHTKRSIVYNKGFANIAQDMIINQIIFDEVMKHDKTKDKVEIPKNKDEFILDKEGNPVMGKNGKPVKNPFFGKNSGLFIPKEYKGEPIFENLYEWLKDKQDEYKKRKSEMEGDGGQGQEQEGQGGGQGQGDPQDGKGKQDGKGQGKGKPSKDGKGKGNGGGEPTDEQGNGQEQGDGNGGGEPKDSFGKPAYGKNGQNGVECQSLDSIFDSMEKGDQLTLDNHLDDDVPEGARKSIVNDFMQRLKNRGLVSADVERMLEKLRKTKKDYLKEIKRTISHHIFGATKRKSITRPNRRGIEGIKGKKKYKNVINVILDTSGSMCGDFERVLCFVFQNDIHINLIQIDTEVKMVEDIKNKRDLQKVVIKGMGGTVLQPAVNYIVDPKNKLHSFNNVILTDGYTDTLNFSEVHGKTLILTTAQAPHYSDPKGIVKCIHIDLEQSLRGK
jgi:predicted metal-dependent peptidase